MLENTFYILGIVFMLSWLVLFVVIIGFGFFIYKKISSLKAEALERATAVTQMSKSEIAGTIASLALTFLVNKIRGKSSKEE